MSSGHAPFMLAAFLNLLLIGVDRSTNFHLGRAAV